MQHEEQPLSPAETAWREYLAWTRGADACQYVETEERAWKRLQLALMDGEITFAPEDGLDIVFTPEP